MAPAESGMKGFPAVRLIKDSCLLLAGTGLQTALPPIGFAGNTKPPILLAIVVFAGFHKSLPGIMGMAFGAGFLLDVLGPAPLGYTSLVLCLLGLLLFHCRDKIDSGCFPHQVFLGGIAGGGVSLALCLFLSWKGQINSSPLQAGWRISGDAAMAAMCFPIAFPLLEHLGFSDPVQSPPESNTA